MSRLLRYRRLTLSGLGLLVAVALPAMAAAQALSAAAETGPLISRRAYHGELRAKSSVPIHAPDIADLWFMTVETVLPDGAAVKQGDVVLTFRSGILEDEMRTLQDEVLVAQAALKRTRNQLAVERIKLDLEIQRRALLLERAQLMVVEGVNLISKLELRKAQLDVQTAELELARSREGLQAFTDRKRTAIEVDQLKLDAAQRQLTDKSQAVEMMKVTAPANGVIYRPFVELNNEKGKVAPGKVVRPGSKLLELPDLSAFQAHLYVRQRDAAIINVGDKATLLLTILPDRPVAARVIDKESFATTRNERLGTKTREGNLKEIHVILDVDPTPEVLPALRPGGTLRAAIESRLADAVLQVPLAAVHAERTDPPRHFVTLTSGQRRPVKLGRSTLTHVEITDGLEPGDRLRLGPVDAPSNGSDP